MATTTTPGMPAVPANLNTIPAELLQPILDRLIGQDIVLEFMPSFVPQRELNADPKSKVRFPQRYRFVNRTFHTAHWANRNFVRVNQRRRRQQLLTGLQDGPPVTMLFAVPQLAPVLPADRLSLQSSNRHLMYEYNDFEQDHLFAVNWEQWFRRDQSRQRTSQILSDLRQVSPRMNTLIGDRIFPLAVMTPGVPAIAKLPDSIKRHVSRTQDLIFPISWSERYRARYTGFLNGLPDLQRIFLSSISFDVGVDPNILDLKQLGNGIMLGEVDAWVLLTQWLKPLMPTCFRLWARGPVVTMYREVVIQNRADHRPLANQSHVLQLKIGQQVNRGRAENNDIFIISAAWLDRFTDTVIQDIAGMRNSTVPSYERRRTINPSQSRQSLATEMSSCSYIGDDGIESTAWTLAQLSETEKDRVTDAWSVWNTNRQAQPNLEPLLDLQQDGTYSMPLLEEWT